MPFFKKNFWILIFEFLVPNKPIQPSSYSSQLQSKRHPFDPTRNVYIRHLTSSLWYNSDHTRKDIFWASKKRRQEGRRSMKISLSHTCNLACVDLSFYYDLIRVTQGPKCLRHTKLVGLIFLDVEASWISTLAYHIKLRFLGSYLTWLGGSWTKFDRVYFAGQFDLVID